MTEKVYKRFCAARRRRPDMDLLRVARANIRHHMRYIGYLTNTRNWLAGERLSYADFAAAAHLSCADYLGDVPWDEDEAAKHWYQRIKSRPAFRPLLADRAPGMTPGRSTPNWISDARTRRSPRKGAGARLRRLPLHARRRSREPAERLRAWLAQGAHGDMDWMAETAERAGRAARALAAGQ